MQEGTLFLSYKASLVGCIYPRTFGGKQGGKKGLRQHHAAQRSTPNAQCPPPDAALIQSTKTAYSFLPPCIPFPLHPPQLSLPVSPHRVHKEVYTYHKWLTMRTNKAPPYMYTGVVRTRIRKQLLLHRRSLCRLLYHHSTAWLLCAYPYTGRVLLVWHEIALVWYANAASGSSASNLHLLVPLYVYSRGACCCTCTCAPPTPRPPPV